MIITAPVTDYIPASILTTLNDLVVRGAADPARYGQLSAVYALRNITQAIPTGVWTFYEWASAYFDTNSEMSFVSHLFVPNRDKYIFVSAGVKFATIGDGVFRGIRIYRDTTLRAENVSIQGATQAISVHVSCSMLITTAEALRIELYQTSGGPINTDATIGTNWLSIIELPIVP